MMALKLALKSTDSDRERGSDATAPVRWIRAECIDAVIAEKIEYDIYCISALLDCTVRTAGTVGPIAPASVLSAEVCIHLNS
jgi:hypothetical protein